MTRLLTGILIGALVASATFVGLDRLRLDPDQGIFARCDVGIDEALVVINGLHAATAYELSAIEASPWVDAPEAHESDQRIATYDQARDLIRRLLTICLAPSTASAPADGSLNDPGAAG